MAGLLNFPREHTGRDVGYDQFQVDAPPPPPPPPKPLHICKDGKTVWLCRLVSNPLVAICLTTVGIFLGPVFYMVGWLMNKKDRESHELYDKTDCTYQGGSLAQSWPCCSRGGACAAHAPSETAGTTHCEARGMLDPLQYRGNLRILKTCDGGCCAGWQDWETRDKITVNGKTTFSQDDGAERYRLRPAIHCPRRRKRTLWSNKCTVDSGCLTCCNPSCVGPGQSNATCPSFPPGIVCDQCHQYSLNWRIGMDGSNRTSSKVCGLPGTGNTDTCNSQFQQLKVGDVADCFIHKRKNTLLFTYCDQVGMILQGEDKPLCYQRYLRGDWAMDVGVTLVLVLPLLTCFGYFWYKRFNNAAIVARKREAQRQEELQSFWTALHRDATAMHQMMNAQDASGKQVRVTFRTVDGEFDAMCNDKWPVGDIVSNLQSFVYSMEPITLSFGDDELLGWQSLADYGISEGAVISCGIGSIKELATRNGPIALERSVPPFPEYDDIEYEYEHEHEYDGAACRKRYIAYWFEERMSRVYHY